MLKRHALALVTLLLVCGPIRAGLAGPAATVRPFTAGSFQPLVAGHGNAPFLLVLWSIDCPPCLREFRLFRELRKAGRQLPLVLVATDGVDRREAVDRVLGRFGLRDAETWVFADANVQRLRYEIDPKWYGEMPRSYFYGRDGERRAVSGGLHHEQLVAWLDTLEP